MVDIGLEMNDKFNYLEYWSVISQSIIYKP